MGRRNKTKDVVAGLSVSGLSLAERLSQLLPEDRAALLADYDEASLRALQYDWSFWARPEQCPPVGDWFCWLVLAGRGFGKTRMGVEWLRSRIEGPTPLQAPKGAPARVALLSHTLRDGILTMLEGESGILACSPPDQRPRVEWAKRRVVWPNGVQAFLYSAEAPEQLRGPQHGLAWADELAKWRYIDESWSNLLFGLRLGKRPQVMVSTTPRPVPLIKSLLLDKDTVVTRGSTYDNRAHLATGFIDQVRQRYEGSRLGRQELHGEILEDVPGALWQAAALETCQRHHRPVLQRVVVGVDPPVSSGPEADACGIIVVGLGVDDCAYVLEDASLQGESPLGWARQAVAAYHRHHADRMVAEVNNGGDLVETLLRQVDPLVSYRAVKARRGKAVRAEPIAALYEQGRVFHCGRFGKLEAEMTQFDPETGQAAGHSPDRMDALVWALHELMLSARAVPQIRGLGDIEASGKIN